MKIKELIKELEMYDKHADVFCSFKSGNFYSIKSLDVGRAKTKPCCVICIGIEINGEMEQPEKSNKIYEHDIFGKRVY